MRNWRQCVLSNNHNHSWDLKKIGVSHGSLLGTILYVIYVNDIEQRMKIRIPKFADDWNWLLTSVGNLDDCIQVRPDLTWINSCWANKWQQISSKKCKLLHIGKSHKVLNYYKNRKWLDSSDKIKKKKDLGEVDSKNLKLSEQFWKQKSTKYIYINVACKSKKIVIKLTDSCIRWFIEYCAEGWMHLPKKVSWNAWVSTIYRYEWHGFTNKSLRWEWRKYIINNVFYKLERFLLEILFSYNIFFTPKLN